MGKENNQKDKAVQIISRQMNNDENYRALRPLLGGGPNEFEKKYLREKENNQITRPKKGSVNGSVAKNHSSITPKMTGPLFYIVLFLTMLDDFFDLFANLAFLGIVASLFSFIISGLIFIYFKIEGVKLGGKKTALWITGIICELIPFVSILPTYTINLLITRKIENGDSKLINKMSKKNNIIRSKRG